MIDYDQLAHEYAQHRQVHPGVLENLVSTGPVTKESCLLEVGCGTGNYAAALAASTGCEIWGVDSSSQMLSRAGTVAADSSIKLILGRAEALSFGPGLFDLIISVDVVHHLDDVSTYFQAAYRALKSGGKLCTVTDSAWIIRHRQPLAVYFPETVAVDLARYPAISDLHRTMTRIGFSQISEQSVEFAHPLDDLQMFRNRAFSVLHLISAEGFQNGLQALERDFSRKPLQAVSRYLLLWGSK